MTTFDVATLNRAQLAALYNSVAAKPVKSFSTHTLAVERVLKLATELGKVVVDGGLNSPEFADPAQHAQELADGDGSDEHGQCVGPEFDADEPALNTEPTAVEPTAAPAPAKPKRAAKAAPPVAAGVKRGPAPKLPDDHVLLTVGPNPKRVGAANHARYALYHVGMTVGAFLDAAHALQGASRGRWRGDLAWDVEYGFITVGPAPKAEG